jgi:molybdenum cofactor synthesis domain-containing protein
MVAHGKPRPLDILAAMPTTKPLRASAVVVGDEILGGFVQDTNSGWLAQRLQAHGVPLDRVSTVPDDLEAIGEALGAELARSRPRLVVTSGGVGSTPDDLTMEAVARHLGRGLVVQPTIDARITAVLERSAAQGTPLADDHGHGMRKMALVPAGAYLLGGASGVAPGVAVDVGGGSRDGGATIVILPGIPSEFRRITATSVEPDLLDGRGRPQHVVEVTHPYPESMLNPALGRLVDDYPDVDVGSYPGRECTIRLKGPAERVEEAASLVRAAIADVAATPGSEALRKAWQAHWTTDVAG